MNKIRWIVYGISLCLACAVIIFTQLHEKPVAYSVDRPTIDTGAFGGDFTLMRAMHQTSHTQKNGVTQIPFSLKDVRGKFVILYFGYTYCPDVCPLGLSNISRAIASLARDRDQFVPIFVTVDPERDTPELLSIYATNFDPAFVMLTGSANEIESAKQQYRVYAKKALSDGKGNSIKPENYLIDHSTYVYLLDRGGKFIKQIPHDMPPEEMQKVFVGLLVSKTSKN